MNDGILLIDKPSGFTSFDVVAVMRGASHIKKIGHSGTLDPMATGVLPLLFGRAAKLCDLLPDSNKRYRASLKLGITTDTLDITGNVISRSDVNVTNEDFLCALEPFRGKINQIPPMYSAIKINGRKLCDIARKGGEVERAPRPVEIYSLAFLGYNDEKDEYSIDVSCSKGTYIRTLIDDIGKKLGCGAVMTSLRRTSACGFDISECVSLEEARQNPFEHLISPDSALTAYREITVTGPQADRFCNGGRLSFDYLTPNTFTPGETVRIYYPDHTFAGLAKANETELEIQLIMKINSEGESK